MLNTLRPPALPLDALQAFAERSYGLSGVWSPLEGERDQNYRVLRAGGVSATFKVCHPAEGDAILQCQATALEHIAEADPALPVPRLIRTRNGEPLARITHDGRDYPVMVLSWLEGHVLGGDTLGRDGLFDLGKLLARLGVAMRGFVNGAPAERDLVWDTRHVLRLAVISVSVASSCTVRSSSSRPTGWPPLAALPAVLQTTAHATVIDRRFMASADPVGRGV